MAGQQQPARRAARLVVGRIVEQVARDRLPVIAAGVAFYGLLSMVPTLVAVIGVGGLVLEPAQITQQLAVLSQLLPGNAAALVREGLTRLTTSDRGALGLGTAGSVAVALWSSSAGVRTLMQALNVAYALRERRSLPVRIGVSLLLAAVVMAGMVVSLTAIVLLPWLGSALQGAGGAGVAVGWLRWPVAAAAFWLGLTLLYRFGPDRRRHGWSWLDRGAGVAVLLWLAASLLFSTYIAHVGSFDRTYGPMGAVVVLLLWFLLSAWAVLLGAEINATLERPEGLAADRPQPQQQAQPQAQQQPQQQTVPQAQPGEQPPEHAHAHPQAHPQAPPAAAPTTGR